MVSSGKTRTGSLLYLIGVSKFRMLWNSKAKSLLDIHSEDFLVFKAGHG